MVVMVVMLVLVVLVTTQIVFQEQSVGAGLENTSFDWNCLSECEWNVNPGKECEGSRSENKVYIFSVSCSGPLYQT